MRSDEFLRGGECDSGRLREGSVDGEGESAPDTGLGDDIVLGLEKFGHCAAVLSCCGRISLLLAVWQSGGNELRNHVSIRARRKFT
jgi:hypothetical protein